MKLSRKIIIPVLLILILVIGFALVNRGAPAAEEGDSLQLVSQTPAQETTADATAPMTARRKWRNTSTPTGTFHPTTLQRGKRKRWGGTEDP